MSYNIKKIGGDYKLYKVNEKLVGNGTIKNDNTYYYKITKEDFRKSKKEKKEELKNDTTKQITIHGENTNKLNEFINKAKKYFPNIDIKNFSYELVPENRTGKEAMNECFWWDLPDFQYNKSNSEYPFFNFIYKKNDKETIEKLKKLSEELDITITENSSSIWYPKRPDDKLNTMKGKIYIDTKPEETKPKYPIFILSKGRYTDKQRLTSKYLEWIKTEYYIVVEPSEFDKYEEALKKYAEKNNENKKPYGTVLEIPQIFLDNQRNNLKYGGGIPARNFIWEVVSKMGFEKHWILDDNMNGYRRLNENQRIYCKSPAVFRCIEDYVDRYSNIGLAGHQYSMFLVSKQYHKPITFNTRVYSSILINNKLLDSIKTKDDMHPNPKFKTDFFNGTRWRGVYNEDVDLSIRTLKAGCAVILCNVFMANKLATMTSKGGNTTTIYQGQENNEAKYIEAMHKKADSLVEQHPEIATKVLKFDHPHHSVNYNKVFELYYNGKETELIPKDKKYIDSIKGKINNYGLELAKGTYIK